jgi:hypothetical protein
MVCVLLGVGASGCVPSFQGFKPVPESDLQPLGSIQSMPDAEILDMDSAYYHRWGQVGQSQRTTFWRMYKRIRINKPAGLKYASFKFLPGGFAVWSPFNKLNDFRVRATCPGGRVLNFDDRNLKEVVVYFYSRPFDAVETVVDNRVYKGHLPGIEVGCVLDVMWEYDLSLQFNRFIMGLMGFSIPLTENLPIRKAHLHYHYAENLDMRADVDPLVVLQILQGRERAKKIGIVMAEIKALIGKLPQDKQASAAAWLKGLKPPQQNLMVAIFERLSPEQRLSALATFPQLSQEERASIIQRLRVADPEEAEPVKGAINPALPMAATPPKDDKARLDLAIEKIIREALVADEADKQSSADTVRITHDREARTFDIYLRDMPALDRRAQFAIGAICKQQALPPRYCKPPRVNARIVRAYDARLQVYQDIRAEWKNIIAWYTRPTWPLQEDRGGFTRNFQLDEEQEWFKDGLPKYAREITKNASTREEKIRVLYNYLRGHFYVQGFIGLVAINFGMSDGNDLLQSYKIKTGNPYVINMVFLIMLRSLGIRAYAALMPYNNFDYRQKGLPDRDVFQGLAVFIPDESEGPWRGLNTEKAEDAKKFVPAGKERVVTQGRVLNPAYVTEPYGLLQPEAEGTEVFVIDYGGGRFFRTPISVSSTTQQKRSYDLAVAPDGTVTGKVEVHLTGHAAARLRKRLYLAHPRDWENWQRERGAWLRSVCGPQIQILNIKNPDTQIRDLSQPISYSYEVKAGHCFPHSQKVMLFKLPSTLPGYQLMAPDRDVQLFFEYARSEKTDIKITFPAGFKLPLKSESQNESFSDAVSYKKSATLSGTTYTKTVEVEFKKRELPANDYKGFRAFWQKLQDKTAYQIAHK